MYELQPAPGIKASKIISLSDDIARNMSAMSARVAIIPGKNVIQLKYPTQLNPVYLSELFKHEQFINCERNLILALERYKWQRKIWFRKYAPSFNCRNNRFRKIGWN